MKDIQRTPRGRWEKIGFWLLVFPVFPAVILNDILEALGFPFWGSTVIVLALLAFTVYLLSRPIRAERSRRLAQDLKRGVFDCAIRFPRSAPGSLRDLWELGAGELQDTTFRFQTRVEDEQGSPASRVKTFPNAHVAPATGSSTRRPQGWTRDWKHVDLETDGGLVQIAGSEPTCTFIAAALSTSRETENETKNGEGTSQRPPS
jgi:hypothetical protein